MTGPKSTKQNKTGQAGAKPDAVEAPKVGPGKPASQASAQEALAGMATRKPSEEFSGPGRRAAIFRIRTADGFTLEGYVHGAGWKLGAECGGNPEAVAASGSRWLTNAINQVNKGVKLSIYEPEPGHVSFTPCSRGETGAEHPEIKLPLKGATFDVLDGRSGIWMGTRRPSDQFVAGVGNELHNRLRDFHGLEEKALKMGEKGLAQSYAAVVVTLESVREVLPELRDVTRAYPLDKPITIKLLSELTAEAGFSGKLSESGVIAFHHAANELGKLWSALPRIWKENVGPEDASDEAVLKKWSERRAENPDEWIKEPVFVNLGRYLQNQARELEASGPGLDAEGHIEIKNHAIKLAIAAMEDSLSRGNLRNGGEVRALEALKASLVGRRIEEA